MKFSQNSKFQVKIRNSKFTSMHTLLLSSNLQSVTFCLTFSYSVPMHVMRQNNAKPQRICRFFFLVSKKRSCRKIWISFRKRLRTTLKKFLDNWSKQFANTTQSFFDKRGFQKFRKKSPKILVYSDKFDKSILAKKVTLPVFLLTFFFTDLLITFGNYKYVKSMFSVPSEWLILRSESHFWLRM